MKLGDDIGALKFAHKESNSDAFGLSSSASAWYWSQAFLDYRYKRHRGFASEYFESIGQTHSKKAKDGAILRAFQASPVMFQLLTGSRKLPNCRIPFNMGYEESLTNAATYWLSNAELWHNTPGAVEWAAKNCRTFMCLLILQEDEDGCKRLGFKCSVGTFKTLVGEGIFQDAMIRSNGKTLLHEAVCSGLPEHLKMLLDAGAKAKTDGWKTGEFPQPLHMACYYDYDPKIIRMLCQAGERLSSNDTLPFQPSQLISKFFLVLFTQNMLICSVGYIT